MDISSLEKAFSVANTVYIFAVAVAAVATFFVYFFASKLTVAKDDELTRFQNESGRAIAEANARAAEANARAAEANEKAEQEQLARVKIEEKLAPRKLTEEQWQEIQKKLEPFAGTEFEVSASTNRETMRVLGIMVELFHRADWKQLPREEAGLTIPTKYGLAGVIIGSGIQVKVDPEYPETTKAAVALVEALTEKGIAAEMKESKQNTHPERIRIDIGEKPS